MARAQRAYKGRNSSVMNEELTLGGERIARFMECAKTKVRFHSETIFYVHGAPCEVV